MRIWFTDLVSNNTNIRDSDHRNHAFTRGNVAPLIEEPKTPSYKQDLGGKR